MQVDFGYFGPPEEHYKWTKEKREGVYVTPEEPSSEIGGEMAAALGAAAVAFHETDPAYAQRLVEGAQTVSETDITSHGQGGEDLAAFAWTALQRITANASIPSKEDDGKDLAVVSASLEGKLQHLSSPSPLIVRRVAPHIQGNL